MEDRGDIDDLTIKGHLPLLGEEFCKPIRSMDMVNERLRVHIFGKCAGLACQVRVRSGDPTDGDGCAHKILLAYLNGEFKPAHRFSIPECRRAGWLPRGTT